MTATASVAGKTYDGDDDANVTLSLSGLVSGEDLGQTVIASFDSVNAGTRTASIDSFQLNDGTNGLRNNYSLAAGDISFSSNTATIATRAITLTADSVSQVYGDSGATLSVTASSNGLASTDSLAEITGTLSRESGSDVGNYDVALGSGSKASNYAITFVSDNNAYEITPRVLTAIGTATASDKVYDGTVNASADLSGLSWSGMLGGDSLGTATASFLDPNVGRNKGISFQFLGGDGHNYAVPTLNGVTADITARPVSASARALNKVYDGTDVASVVFDWSGILAGEDLDYRTDARFDSPEVGERRVTINSLVLEDGDAGLAANYSVNLASITFTNNRATISTAEPARVPQTPTQSPRVVQIPREPADVRTDFTEVVSFERSRALAQVTGQNRPGVAVLNTGFLNEAILQADTPILISRTVSGGFDSIKQPSEDVSIPAGREVEIPISNLIGSGTISPTTLVSISDGESGSDWLEFDRETQTFKATLPEDAPERADIRIAMVDEDGNVAAFTVGVAKAAGQDIQETPENLNRGATDNLPGSVEPTAKLPGFLSVKTVRPESVTRGSGFTFKVPDGTFVHENSSEPLRYTASLANGSPLPTWMRFNPETQTFSGEAPEGESTQFEVIVKAIDSGSQEAQVQLTIELD